MKKTERDIRERLQKCAGQIRIDEGKKKTALGLIARIAEQKEIRHRPGWREILSVQLLSVPMSAWFWQAMFFALLPLAEELMRKKGPVYGYRIFPTLSVCMATGSVVFVNELSRHFSCKMAELEQSCFLNLSQLWLVRVCCISVVDALFVIGLGMGKAQHYGFGAFSFAVYALTPFFLANAMLLFFLSLGRNRNRIGQAGLAVLAALGLAAECLCGRIYERVWLPVWVAVFVAALLLYAGQIREIRKKMEEESLCWS